MDNWTLPLSMIPSIALILTSMARSTLGLTDELNNKIKDPTHDRSIVTAKLRQIKRLSLASMFIYLSMAALVVTVLLEGAGWMPHRYEEIALLLAVALFFVAIVIMVLFSSNAYFIRQRQFMRN